VSRLDVSLAGVPASRGESIVGAPQTDRSSAVLDGAGAVGSVLLVDASRPWPPAAVHDGPAVLPLAAPGAAVTAIARDAVILAVGLTWVKNAPATKASWPVRNNRAEWHLLHPGGRQPAEGPA
jgi:hypothetical protein